MTSPRPLRQPEPSCPRLGLGLTDLLRRFWVWLWADNETNGPGSEG